MTGVSAHPWATARSRALVTPALEDDLAALTMAAPVTDAMAAGQTLLSLPAGAAGSPGGCGTGGGGRGGEAGAGEAVLLIAAAVGAQVCKHVV
jgi:hypothetical protein